MDSRQLLEQIDQIKEASKDFMSNIYSPRQLQGQIVQRQPSSDFCIWIVKLHGYFRLFFAGDKSSVNLRLRDLKNDFQMPVVADIVSRLPACNIFEGTNFRKYMTLSRLSMNKVDVDSSYIAKTEYASLEQVQEIQRLFGSEFDVLVDQIPDEAEIREAIGRNEILVVPCGCELKGFIWHEKTGRSSCVRYWCVASQYREQKVGGTLIKSYFAHNADSTRHILWVKETNENAIKRYQHYGYRPDGTFDLIYVMEQ